MGETLDSVITITPETSLKNYQYYLDPIHSLTTR
jgi:hypothetical protein